MPPKNKKKGRKDDDDIWEAKERAAAAASTSPPPTTTSGPKSPLADAGSDDDERPAKKSAQAAFSFAAMDDGAGGEEEEDFGGLMSALKSQKKKDKKKSKKAQVVSDDEADLEPSAGGAEILDDEKPHADDSAPRGAVEVSAEDMFAEDEPKKKGKKGKKGGKKGGAKADEEEEDDFAILERARKAREEADEKAQLAAAPASAPAPTAPAADVDEESADEADGQPTKVLSKKEKEKLKKEKEKAKKKAQAAAKKAATSTATAPTPGDASEATAAEPPAAVEAPEKDDDDGEEEADDAAAAGGTSAKNKKKKKKKAAEKAPEPAKEEPKKKSGKLSALRAAMEERARLEAEAKAKAEEEERLRKEEEERLEAEEKRKEEEKQRKREREKAKRDELKKAGKLLTPKQKAEKAAAEARLAALVASGVQVAGLSERTGGGSGGTGPKRPNYGGKKKGGKKDPLADKVSIASPNPSEDTASVAAPPEDVEEEPVVVAAVEEKPVAVPVKDEPAEGVKDSWDAVSDDGVKDDWDASSEEEEEKPPKAAAASASSTKANGKPTGAASVASGKGAPAPAKQAAQPASTKTAPSRTNGKPAAAQEESSEEEDSDDDDDDDSEDDSEEDSDDDSSDEEDENERRQAARDKALAARKAEAAEKRKQREADAIAARSAEDMRSPICCILGHVDTGKTKLLDKIRQTNVQEGEAGGITQQIGATFFPMDSIRAKTRVLREHDLEEYKLPGLLVIDTPGHESFTNLRSRGSTLCNIAILVIDIMHGLEPQTRESLELLRSRKTPFVVALNKIDRIFGWTAVRDNSFRDSLSKQNAAVQRQFNDKVKYIKGELQALGLNSELYYENTSFAKNVSIVPTSAITGEGVPDLLMLLIKLTQERMSERLMYLSTLECTVLEVKVIEGLGTTIDVVLSNGILREGDKIVVCGLNGAIVTQVRALLTPQLMKELRVKGAYVHHQTVKAALGVKIVAPDLEKAIAGSRLLLLTDDDDEDDLKDAVMEDLTDLMGNISKQGVCVQASTLGSLEALISFLNSSKIPMSGINIGPVFKRDIMRAGTMLEKAPEFAVMLAFDVPIDKEAERLAEETGVKIFKADIIYHLFDAFTAHQKQVLDAKRADAAPTAIFPVRLKILRAFATRDPIIVGCDILEGTARVGTPICVVKTDPTTKKKTVIPLGKITGLEINHVSSQLVKKEQVGAGVAVKIEPAAYQQSVTYGRQFDDKDELISQITRQSLDVLKDLFREEVVANKTLLFRLKAALDIP